MQYIDFSGSLGMEIWYQRDYSELFSLWGEAAIQQSIEVCS